MYKQFLIAGILNILIWSTHCSTSNHDEADESIIFDPTFGGHEMVHMNPNEPFLDPYLIYACSQRYAIVECLEHYMRKAELQKEPNYKPLLPDLDQQSLAKRKSSENEKERLDRIRSLMRKRNSNEELMSIFNKLIANNMRLKSNIKTTRF